MVTARWINNKLVVKPVAKEDDDKLPEDVKESVAILGLAVYNCVAYSSDEQTAREKLE